MLTFTGTEAWIVPAGVHNLLRVEVRAPGGGAGTSQVAGAFKGGSAAGGAYASIDNHAVTPGESITATVPAGGGPSTGGADAHFRNASTVMAKGGPAGANSTTLAHGAGGTAPAATSSVGTVRFKGGNGAAGSTNAAGGGGGAGDAAAGGDATLNSGTAGTGGNAGGGVGGTGGTVTVAPTNGAVPGGGGGAPATNLQTPGSGERGEIRVFYIEVGVNTVTIAQADVESLADIRGDTLTVTQADVESLADQGTNPMAITQADTESLAEQGTNPVGVSQQDVESLADQGTNPIVVAQADTESLAEQGTNPVGVSQQDVESLADQGTNPIVVAQQAAEAIAESSVQAVIVVTTTQNWKRVSPGLSGTVYDETGTTPIVGAKVYIFRDPVPPQGGAVAELTSDALGNWNADLDPAFLYWIAGWKDGATQLEDATDRHIPTVDTVVEEGT